MAYVKFNHLSAKEFNDFIPEATKVANNELFNKILLIGACAFALWLVFRDYPVNNGNLKAEQ